MRQRKQRSNANSRRDNTREGAADSSILNRKWILFAIGLAVLCVGVYWILPRDYSRTPAKHQREPPTGKYSGAVDDAAETRLDAGDSGSVSTCEELLGAAKRLLDSSDDDGSGAVDYEQALDLIANCIVKEPNNTAALWNLAFVLLKTGRVDEAVVFIDEALTLRPQNVEFHRSAGLLFSDLGRHHDTILALERYLELLYGVPSWPHLLAEIVGQREDEWNFLVSTNEQQSIIDILQRLLKSYLNEKLVLKGSYLYKIVIGLRGVSGAKELLSPFAFLSFGLGDARTGIKYLRLDMEVKYVEQGFGNEDNAYEVITAHSLRLLTAGIDAHVVAMTRYLLMVGKNVWDEFEYNCQLTQAETIEYNGTVLQSDIRNILSLCLTRQGVISGLIKEEAAVFAENRFGWTPLLNVVPLNSVPVLGEILSSLECDALSRTALGQTSLHIAAMKGSYGLVERLTQAGLSPAEKDIFNNTALDVACMHRWSAERFLNSLGRSQLPSGCLQEVVYHPPPEKISQGGWNDSPFVLPASLTRDECDFDVIADISDEEFLYQYLTLQRPVLIRGAIAATKGLFRQWQRARFVEKFGRLIFKEVPVPYAESFGFESGQNRSTTVKDFVAKMDRLSEMGEDQYPSQPTYIFETVSSDSLLLEGFQLPSILNPDTTHIAMSEAQFYVGPALSGAPGHFHRSAWNVLVYGKKRWFLYPPTEAFYSRQHVWEWWRQTGASQRDGAMQCTQHPGDLMFIPDMWGHAVLNLRESVGLAAEFVYGASEFSL